MEFFEDIWENDSARAMQMLGSFEDDIVLETGDKELDDIERRLARGEDPNEVLKGWGDGEGNKAEAEAAAENIEDIEDDYLDEAPPQGLSWTRKE